MNDDRHASAAGWSSPHPYIPNSTPEVKSAMLAAAGLQSITEVFREIPAHLQLNGPLNIPAALGSEWELTRHVQGLLDRNTSTVELLSFLGAGCYPHHVPAVCSEINGRAEFLTAYAGEPYEDHGKWQALFEYSSLMAELLDMDVVNIPTYDGYQAAATALRMSGRITGRSTVLVGSAVLAAKLAKIADYLDGALDIELLPCDSHGALDCERFVERLGDHVAAVYIETPNAFGVVESEGPTIAAAAHARGALVVAATDPVSLGYLEPPVVWGADLVCGDIQSLGLGMHFGGANGGFIASRDEERIVFEYPSRLFGLAPTAVPGELGFCDIAYERTSLANRERGNEWVGTAAALWGITAGVYLSLMGPAGMADIGAAVAARTRYAIDRLTSIRGLEVPFAASPHWREFLIRVTAPGVAIADVNERLLASGILACVDIGDGFPELGPCGLVCVTECHSQSDIDTLAHHLQEALE